MSEKLKILIVEDNPVNMELVVDILENQGYEVHAATNGLEVMSFVKHIRPDLVLMDLQLPGMSGLKVTALLKADSETAEIPVVAVTAFAMDTDEERAREAGCCGVITKPINTREFPRLIKKYLSEMLAS